MEPPQNSSPQETESTHDQENPKPTKNKTKNHPRRFNDEQIKSLESIFKLETKLDSRKKLQIAKDLELHPRQVSIWFQNKRARYKSKQIEQEYNVLKANYDSLLIQFDELKNEKQSLQMQLEKLSDLVKVNLRDKDGELKEYPNSSSEEMDHNDAMIKINDHEEVITKYFDRTIDQEFEEEEISHLSSPETWCNFSSSGRLFDSTGSSNWWDN